MEGAGNPHHQRALDMLSGRQDESDDEERIRRPPEPTQYDDRRETVQSTWTDGASVYSNNAGDEYPYPEGGDEYPEPYPESIIDVPAFPNPHHVPPELSRDSRFFGPRSPQPGFWDRFRGKGRPHVGWTQSLIAIVRSSCKHTPICIYTPQGQRFAGLNVLLAFVPIAWALHWVNSISHTVQFACTASPSQSLPPS